MNDIQAIITKAKEGDSEAFSLLYKEYYVPIYRYIYLRIRNKEQSEDLTQDVFLKIYRSIATLAPTGDSPLSYFYTIAKNTLIDFWRKRNLNSVSDDEHLLNIADPSPTALDAASLKEKSSLLHECLEQLTRDQREVITLKFINDLSNEEVAKIVGKKETAVRQLQVRALRTLGKIFREKYGNEQ